MLVSRENNPHTSGNKTDIKNTNCLLQHKSSAGVKFFWYSRQRRVTEGEVSLCWEFVLDFSTILSTIKRILCLRFHASLIYINNCPTRCNTKQSIYYSASSLYMFRVSTTPIISSTQNGNYSLRYWLYFSCSYLPQTCPNYSLATLEGDSCKVTEAVVTVLCIPEDGCC